MDYSHFPSFFVFLFFIFFPFFKSFVAVFFLTFNFIYCLNLVSIRKLTGELLLIPLNGLVQLQGNLKINVNKTLAVRKFFSFVVVRSSIFTQLNF